jgi:hypothetical protein
MEEQEKFCPEYFAAKAERCEAAKDWTGAAHYWRRASGVTIGNNRAARYDYRAEQNEAKAKGV